ncbi:hypothetical protein HYH03_003768 [Edaphochlamys debaryana]|uniref:Calcineurin-like phosphoesterase domain-containing protein n=1 Tax=Edaphochlamys debaryana TaxID=47281 RepID=A0A835YBL6_9CHLO|nr:hypothetical protein HYH03_003768 [Edaphochlamys debaryana]|eukprot:KAG2498517.1 hypothetical protein HYH03_003768 [Edaphochlamys debaryana]
MALAASMGPALKARSGRPPLAPGTSSSGLRCVRHALWPLPRPRWTAQAPTAATADGAAGPAPAADGRPPSTDSAAVEAAASTNSHDGGEQPLPPPAAAAPKRRGRRPKAAAAEQEALAGPAGDAVSATAAAAQAAEAKPKRRRTRRPAAAADPSGPSLASAGSASASASDEEAPAAPAAAAAVGPRRRGRRPAASSSLAVAASGGGGGSSGSLSSVDGGAAAAAAAAAAGVPDDGGPVVFSTKLPGPAWAEKKRWVVFSDLHVRESSLATCLEVMRAVEAEARARDAGVMFLGDFWDKRGALPVEPLNQVLQELSRWRCPVLMLVGNHDQIDLGGRRHSLTPLELACPHVHVFEEPTLWNHALWLPYRREGWILTRAMAQAAGAAGAADAAGATAAADGGSGGGGGAGAGGGGGVNAIFMHADVRTARTNQWRQAQEGLDPSAFPPALPAYSGHYHLPHTVPGTAITYVGSPYQVSLGEAGEAKRLLVLSAPAWAPEAEVPLALGPRHHRVSGAAAAERLVDLARAAAAAAAAGGGGGAAGVGGVAAEAGAEAEAAGVWRGGQAEGGAPRRGDRVKLWLSAAEAGDGRVAEALAQLEAAGVAVEQVLQPEARPPRVEAAEGASPEELIAAYFAGPGAGPDAEAAAVVVRQAVAAARDAAGVGDAAAAAGGGAAVAGGGGGGCVDLDFEWVRLCGFGPFVEDQTYPLASRGVRVVVGSNLDEPGADSNGAGKTCLVGAPLWALTGDVLARTESGGGGRVPVDALRNDGCPQCRVAVGGRLNGRPFVVTREVKRGKTSGLSLCLDGQDLTQQDISSTAELIRSSFATDLLRCSAFFGQNDITGLLEANDATLKQRLGLVVDLEVWEAARQTLTPQRKSATSAAAEALGRGRLLGEQAGRRAAEVAAAEAAEADWAGQHAARLARYDAEVMARAAEAAAAAAALAAPAAAARGLAASLRSSAAAAEAEQRQWEAEVAAQQAAMSTPPVPAAAPVAARLPSAAASASASASGLGSGSGAAPCPAAAAAEAEAAEAAAAEAVRGRRVEEAKAYSRRTECQAAAGMALGALKQRQASLAEYTTAVSQLATVHTVQTANGHGHAPVKTATATASVAESVTSTSYDGYAGTNGHHKSDGGYNGSGYNGGGGGEAGGGEAAVVAVCDRCRQPISSHQYAANVERLEADAQEARQVYDRAAAELAEAEEAFRGAAARAQEADAALTALVRHRTEEARRAAAAATAAAAAAEREARAAAEATAAAQREAWAAATRALTVLRQRLAGSERRRGELLSAAADLDRVALDLDSSMAAFAVQSEALHQDPAVHAHVEAAASPEVAAAQAAAAAEGGPAAAAEQLLAAARGLAAAARREAAAAARALAGAARELEQVRAEAEAAAEAAAAAEARSRALAEADRALGRSGIPSLLLEDVLGQLQTYTAGYLSELCDGYLLELSATRGGAAGAAGGEQGPPQRGAAREKEEIQKVIKVRDPLASTSSSTSSTGPSPSAPALRVRDVRQLSGGERRRLALALCLGFERLVRARRRLASSLLVLDEVLQQLDNTGCERVACVLRERLPHSTVLVVGQGSSAVAEAFEVVDVVEKRGGAARVRVAA